MSNLSVIIPITIIAYLVMMIVIGVIYSRKNKNVSDFYLGGIMVFLWKFVISDLSEVFAIYELLPAFITAVIAIVVVSLLTSAPEKEVTDEYDEVSAEVRS